MKKKLSIILASCVTAFSLLAATLSAVSWFVTSFQMSPEDSVLKGGSEGAYYEDGDGLTEQTAFIISKPRHLYNFAWLQYLGYYNDTAGKQYYFKVKEDLDMSGWILPPAGTEENPFIGNFNGQGHTVSNLTVSNTFTDFTSGRPSRVTSSYFNSHLPEIVGFFGVVGDYNDRYTVNGEPKTGVTYNSSTNEVKNTGILNATIKSGTSQTLVGIAAGYVNAKLDNVAVNESSLYTVENASAISSITSNVSDFSLVGYCTDEFIDDVKLRSDDADIPTLENPNTDSGGDNWGGSINMLDMYTYLRSVINSSTAFTYDSAERVDIDINGNETGRSITGTSIHSGYNSNFNEYYRYYGSKYKENDEEYASYTFARTSDNTSFNQFNSDDTKYVCLYGGKHLRASNNGTNANLTTTTYNAYFRISNGTANYLSYRGSISNQTSTNNASGWRWDGEKLYTTYSNTKYYLNNNSGSLSASTTGTTTWTYDSTNKNIYSTISGTNYYLDLSGTTWRLVSTASNYYLIKNGNNYMTHTNPVTTYANVTNTASTTEPTTENVKWYYESSTARFSATSTGTMYYLQRNGNNVRYYRNTTNSLFTASAEYGDSVALSYNGYYVYNTGTNWRNNTTTTNRVTILKRTQQASEGHNITCTEYTTNSSSTSAAYLDTYPTYFPLTREKDEDGNYTGAGKPDVKNTGYVISGANLTDTKQSAYGDIRVARFEIKDIATSLSGDTTYSSNRLEIVTRTCVRGENNTYTDSGWTRIEDDYNGSNTINNDLSTTFTNKKNYKSALRLSKYKNSRNQLDSTLSTGGGGIYGLHFMNAAISTSNLITVPNVTVLDGKTLDANGKATGSQYTNYQLPQDSIDFNLKDQGFINFFAGTYFTNNDTFFSLHKITRDNNNSITNIQQISKIYAPASGDPSPENPYVYSFDGNKPANSGDLVFDTSWITSPSIVDDSVYYFEIPVNAGEYALGSVSGKNGAYLMYLDIGAGTNNFKDIVTTEKIDTEVKNGIFPTGVDFLEFTAGSTWTAVKGGKTGAVTVGSTTNADQTLTYSYDDDIITVSTTGSDPPVSAKFIHEGKDIKKKVGSGSATSLSFTPSLLYNMTTDSITYELYNVFTSAVNRTIDETITITNGSAGTEIQLSTPVLSEGFAVSTAATFSVASGPATVTSAGLVTLTGSGEVKIAMTYVETMANVEQWATSSIAVNDDTEGTIFACHFYDYDSPNVLLRYKYDGPNKIYTVYVTASEDTELIIDALPPAGYTVVIVVNGNTAGKTTLTSASTTTSVNIVGA